MNNSNIASSRAWVTLFVVSLASGAALLADTQPAPVGPEVLVTQDSVGEQIDPAISTTEQGEHWVAWTAPAVSPETGTRIVLRGIAADGTASNEQTVNQTGGLHGSASVITDSNGFAVVWEGPDADGRGIFYRVYAGNGNPVTSQLPANFITAGDQTAPTVAANQSNRILIAWQSINGDTDGNDIFVRLFTSPGVPLTSTEQQINLTDAGDQIAPAAVGIKVTGAFAVAWEGEDSSGQGILHRRLNNDGVPIDLEDVPVNSTEGGDQQAPAISASRRVTGDQYTIVWHGPDGGGRGIFAHSYTQVGGSLGGERLVSNENAEMDQHSPHLTVDNGEVGLIDFVVTWIQEPVVNRGSPILVRGRRQGTPLGFSARPEGAGELPEFTINQSNSAHQHPRIGGAANGDFLVVWQTLNGALDTQDIVARRFQVQTIFEDGFELVEGLDAWDDHQP